MASPTDGYRLKKEFQVPALKALREIIGAARLVVPPDPDEDKRRFAGRSINDPQISEGAASYENRRVDPAVRERRLAQVQRLRSFLSFARDEGFDDCAWATIETNLYPSRKASDQTLAIVGHLLGIAPDLERMTSVLPEATAVVHPTSHPGNVIVDWHQTIDDHRQVILGQLPHADLFPAVFVFARNRQQWYPQHDLVRLKKPGGVAFVCNARFGNPRGIGHKQVQEEDAFPWYGDVHVYALRAEPDKKLIPPVLTTEELAKWVADHGQVGKVEKLSVVREDAPIVSIVVEGSKAAKEWTIRPPECLTRSFPFDLTWQTRHRIYFEIRKTPADEVVFEGDVPIGGRMRIVDKGAAGAGATGAGATGAGVRKVALPGVGTYRLRYWSLRKPFLDQELDLWLEITREEARAGRERRAVGRDGAGRRAGAAARR